MSNKSRIEQLESKRSVETFSLIVTYTGDDERDLAAIKASEPLVSQAPGGPLIKVYGLNRDFVRPH